MGRSKVATAMFTFDGERAQKNNFETSISGRARGEMKPLDFRRKKHLTDGNPGKFIF